MSIYNNVRFVIEKSSVSPSERLPTTDVAVESKNKRKYTRKAITRDNKNFIKKMSGKGLKVIKWP